MTINTIQARSVDSWALAAASVAADDLQAMQARQVDRRGACLLVEASTIGRLWDEPEFRKQCSLWGLTALEEARIRQRFGT